MTLAVDDGGLVARLTPTPSVCRHGVVRAAAYVYLVDVVAGLEVDTERDQWTFTSDLSLRVPVLPVPHHVDAVSRALRSGRRSITAEVTMRGPDGELGYSLAGFAKVPRRPGDPPKPQVDLAHAAELFGDIPTLDEPVRDVAGVRAVDRARGEVAIELRDDLRNPAGALQGAMVALVAECAAEDLAEATTGRPHVVTDVDIRFVAQARHGPIVSRGRLVGPPDDGSVRVELFDRGQGDRLVTAVLARVRPAPGSPDLPGGPTVSRRGGRAGD